jgi:hypothetical protein
MTGVPLIVSMRGTPPGSKADTVPGRGRHRPFRYPVSADAAECCLAVSGVTPAASGPLNGAGSSVS